MIGGLGDLQGSTDVDDGLALGDQLVSRFEFADDLLSCVAGSFHGEGLRVVWLDEDSRC